MAGEFVDSNVLLYVTSADVAKADRAERLILRGLTVSVQVLNEVTNVSSKKFKRAWPEVNDLLDRLAAVLDVHPLTESMHREARRIADRYRMQWWDALLLAAALALDCDTLYSENMHAGLLVDGRVRIVNPFA